jgi:hypothetical protein
MTTDQLQGMPLVINGKEYVMTPLSFEDMRRLIPTSMIGPLYITFTISVINVCAGIVHAALSRNYPELTLDQASDRGRA